MKTTISPPIVLLSVSVPAELSQAIKALREAEGLTICEWMLKDPRVRKWARTHAVPLPKPGKKRISRDAARWLDLTGEDWNRGIRHVANLLGVSRQAVAWKKSGSAPGKAMGSWNQVYPERRGGKEKPPRPPGRKTQFQGRFFNVQFPV